MGISDLKGWFLELAGLDNPVRREFHLFTLLSGSRPSALQEIRTDRIDFRRRTLHISKPKGGKKRAFDIRLSRQMVLCLIRAIRFGREMHPSQAREWVFPANSASGHLAETKEDRDELSKWGNDLRQTFRTIATTTVPRATASCFARSRVDGSRAPAGRRPSVIASRNEA
jgi:integrase